MLESRITTEDIVRLVKPKVDRNRIRRTKFGLFLRSGRSKTIKKLAKRYSGRLRRLGLVAPPKEELTKQILDLSDGLEYWIYKPIEEDGSWRGNLIGLDSSLIEEKRKIPVSVSPILHVRYSVISSDQDIRRHNNIKLLQELMVHIDGKVELRYEGRTSPDHLAVFNIEEKIYYISLNALNQFSSILKEKKSAKTLKSVVTTGNTLADHLRLLYRFIKGSVPVIDTNENGNNGVRYRSQYGFIFNLQGGHQHYILTELTFAPRLKEAGYKIAKE